MSSLTFFLLFVHLFVTKKKCRALSAAIFNGDPNRTEYPTVAFRHTWLGLWNGTIDVSTTHVTFNMARDVYEEFSKKPITFSTPWFFTGTTFAGLPEMVDCVNRRDTLSPPCLDLEICSMEGSTTNQLIREEYEGASIKLIAFTDDLFTSLQAGECNVVAGDPLLLAEAGVREIG